MVGFGKVELDSGELWCTRSGPFMQWYIRKEMTNYIWSYNRWRIVGLIILSSFILRSIVLSLVAGPWIASARYSSIYFSCKSSCLLHFALKFHIFNTSKSSSVLQSSQNVLSGSFQSKLGKSREVQKGLGTQHLPFQVMKVEMCSVLSVQLVVKEHNP